MLRRASLYEAALWVGAAIIASAAAAWVQGQAAREQNGVGYLAKAKAVQAHLARRELVEAEYHASLKRMWFEIYCICGGGKRAD